MYPFLQVKKIFNLDSLFNIIKLKKINAFKPQKTIKFYLKKISNRQMFKKVIIILWRHFRFKIQWLNAINFNKIKYFYKIWGGIQIFNLLNKKFNKKKLINKKFFIY
jgi:hypothetical protein